MKYGFPRLLNLNAAGGEGLDEVKHEDRGWNEP